MNSTVGDEQGFTLIELIISIAITSMIIKMDTAMMTSSKVNARERRMRKVTLNAENHNTPGDRRWMLNCLLAKGSTGRAAK